MTSYLSIAGGGGGGATFSQNCFNWKCFNWALNRRMHAVVKGHLMYVAGAFMRKGRGWKGESDTYIYIYINKTISWRGERTRLQIQWLIVVIGAITMTHDHWNTICVLNNCSVISLRLALRPLVYSCIRLVLKRCWLSIQKFGEGFGSVPACFSELLIDGRVSKVNHSQFT